MALLPVAGQMLIEHQARTMSAAGAGHIVVLVDQIPAELVAGFDRLRADGVNIEIARDARDAADRIHPDEQLFVLLGGVVTDLQLSKTMTGADDSVIFTVPDGIDAARYELIDATDRWAGAALINGQILRDTVALLGDWTLAPTLLRTSLQTGAVRRRIPDGCVHGLVQTVSEAAVLTRELVARRESGDRTSFRTVVASPIARYAVPWMLRVGAPLDVVVILPIVLAASALLLAMFGWFASGFLLLILAHLPAAAAEIVADVGARSAKPLSLFEKARLPLFCLMIGLVGSFEFMRGIGWGALVMACWTIIQLALPSRPLHGWRDPDYAVLIMLVAAAAAQPLAGMGAIIAALIADQVRNRMKPV